MPVNIDMIRVCIALTEKCEQSIVIVFGYLSSQVKYQRGRIDSVDLLVLLGYTQVHD